MKKQIIKARIREIFSFSFPKRQGGTSHSTFLETEKGFFVWKAVTESPYRYWLKREADVIATLNNEINLSAPISIEEFNYFNECL